MLLNQKIPLFDNLIILHSPFFYLHNSNLGINLQGLRHNRYIIIFYFININCLYYLNQYLPELLNCNDYVADV